MLTRLLQVQDSSSMPQALVDMDPAINIEPALKARIEQAAQRNGHSLHDEIKLRLQGSLAWDEGSPDMLIRILQLKLTEQSARIALQQAQLALSQALAQPARPVNELTLLYQVLAEAQLGVCASHAQVQQAQQRWLQSLAKSQAV